MEDEEATWPYLLFNKVVTRSSVVSNKHTNHIFLAKLAKPNR